MTHVNVTFAKISALLSILAATGAARADAPVQAVADGAAPPVSSATTGTTERVSLPWQLRPVLAGNMARVDTTAAAFNDGQGNIDLALPTVLSASHRLTAEWAATVRLGFAGNNAPGAALDGGGFANPVVGATYMRALGGYRLALFGATTIPVGSGGGTAPNLRAAEANAASMAARPAEASMFAVNYLTALLGADLAYVDAGHGLTIQGEVNLLQFIRVRGGASGGATDAFRTQATFGLHVGYFIGSHVSLSGDVHHRRWLSHPTSGGATPAARITFTGVDLNTTTVAVGPRLHFRLGQRGWIRPGLSFVRGLDARGFDAPLITAQATAIQLDIPVTF